MAIDRDAGESKLSLAFVRDQVEDVGAERLEDSLTVFAHEVGVRTFCKRDSKIR